MKKRAEALTSFAVTLSLVAVLILGLGHLLPSASAGARVIRHAGPCTGFRWRARDVAPAVRPDVIRERVGDLMDCAARTYGIDAYAFKTIAQRESGWWPFAKNPDAPSACRRRHPFGSCGLFQHLIVYWPGRAATYLQPGWFAHPPRDVSVLNARANAIVSARMWKAQGGPCPAWC